MITEHDQELNIEALKRKLVPILKRHEVSRAAIFGSMVTGKATKSSDIDLLVDFTGEKSLLDLVALKLDLEEAFNRKVDISTYRALNPLIRNEVLKQEVRVL